MEVIKVNVVTENQLPDGWTIVGHKHVNCGEGHGVEPYDITIYKDKNGDEHEVVVGTFNVTAAKLK